MIEENNLIQKINFDYLQDLNLNKKLLNELELGSSKSLLNFCRHLESLRSGLVYFAAWNLFPTHFSCDDESYGISFNIAINSCIKANGKEKSIDLIKKLLQDDFIQNGESYWYHEHMGNLALNEDSSSLEAYYHYALAAFKSKGKALINFMRLHDLLPELSLAAHKVQI